MNSYIVPLWSLRYIDLGWRMTPGRIDHLIHRYRLGTMRIVVWRDFVIEGAEMYHALRLRSIYESVVVYHRLRMPIQEYPGDLP